MMWIGARPKNPPLVIPATKLQAQAEAQATYLSGSPLLITNLQPQCQLLARNLSP